jgi:2-polyprenyl-3-methyl-5-hydroxy-6-metoxy-1,4-benzoquinol methylase
MQKKLIVIATEQRSYTDKPPTSRKLIRRQEVQAKFEKLWNENPGQFDPQRNAMQKERLKRTLDLILQHSTLDGKHVADLGCGNGYFAMRLADAGATVDAVDIAGNALKTLNQYPHPKIRVIQDLIPSTTLEDDTYDIVISTEVIGYLSRDDRRLYMAELSRLMKPDGLVICSTGIDINTQDGPQVFGILLETEFQPIEWVFSYHAYFIRLKHFFELPVLYAQGRKDSLFRKQQLAKRGTLSKWWYWLNSSIILGSIWRVLSNVTKPLVHRISNSTVSLLNLEKICRTISPESGISHIIFLGKRRPLEIPTKEELLAIVPKGKRQVWE